MSILHVQKNYKIFVGNKKIFVYDLYVEKQNELILGLAKNVKNIIFVYCCFVG